MLGNLLAKKKTKKRQAKHKARIICRVSVVVLSPITRIIMFMSAYIPKVVK